MKSAPGPFVSLLLPSTPGRLAASASALFAHMPTSMPTCLCPFCPAARCRRRLQFSQRNTPHATRNTPRQDAEEELEQAALGLGGSGGGGGGAAAPESEAKPLMVRAKRAGRIKRERERLPFFAHKTLWCSVGGKETLPCLALPLPFCQRLMPFPCGAAAGPPSAHNPRSKQRLRSINDGPCHLGLMPLRCGALQWPASPARATSMGWWCLKSSGRCRTRSSSHCKHRNAFHLTHSQKRFSCIETLAIPLYAQKRFSCIETLFVPLHAHALLKWHGLSSPCRRPKRVASCSCSPGSTTTTRQPIVNAANIDYPQH